MANGYTYADEVNKVISRFVEVNKPKLSPCPECHGAKELMYSCCSGDIIDEDFPMCPDCKEHIGLEPCHICEGEGTVREEDLTIIKEVA